MNTEKLNQETGNRVKKALERYGLTQAELARRIPGDTNEGHASPVFINHVVKGKKPLTRNLAWKISDVLPGLRPGWLLCDPKEPHMTDNDAEQALFEKVQAYFREQINTRMAIRRAASLLLQSQGITWNPDLFGNEYDPAPVVMIQGQAFTEPELDRIAHKLNDYLRLELEYAVKTKEASAELDHARQQASGSRP